MTTFADIALSGATDRRNIKVAATSTPGTTIHTAHATSKDELWLWAVNTDTTERKLTLELGGTTSPDDLMEVKLPPECGFILVCPGLRFTNSVVIKAFASSGNVVNVNGFVNRIT